MISSPEQGVVYYPSGPDIYALYTRTREREIVTRLPFSPRCLVAGNGWLCCGGEPAHYSAIPLNDGNTDLDFSINLDADPDARLPLDLDPSRRSSASRDIPSAPRRSRGHSHPLLAPVKPVGKEINNCITLWFPSPGLSEKAYDSPVAVVANNDRTVSMVNLEDPEAEILQQLTYPDCVNRAVISPDGELLVAILDDPFLYVHRRRPEPRTSSRHSERAYRWAPANRIQLESQKQSDQSTLRGSFAACFSRSGKYLAIGTQYGIISIFDVETLDTDDNIKPLVTFTTSRPMETNGAVRSMEFSPGPFDLLAWTEASGRAGVADVRDLCLSRQLLMVDCRLDGVERINVSERSTDPVIDPRLRSFRSFRAESPGDSTPDYLGLDFERRQLRNLTQEILDRHQSPLTPEEMDILQAHRVARHYRDAETEGLEPIPWSPWASEPRPARTGDIPSNGEGSNNADRRTPALPAALRDFVNSDRSISSSFRSFINERNQDRERRGGVYEARREPSNAEALEEGSGRSEAQASSPADSTNDLERLITPPTREPWAELEGHPRIRSPQLPTVAQSSRLAQRQDDRRQVEERRTPGERRYSHRPRPRQTWRGLDELGLGNFDENVILRGVLRTGPVNTMGCCWSPDGRIL